MLHLLQAHHPFCQEFEHPRLSPTWSLATRQMNELGFFFAVQAPPLLSLLEGSVSGSSHSQVLLDTSLPGIANQGSAVDGELEGLLLIGGVGFVLADASLMSRVRATR